MFQGIMLSYVNYRGVVQNELEDDDYFGKETNDSNKKNVNASAYSPSGGQTEIDYSGFIIMKIIIWAFRMIAVE